MKDDLIGLVGPFVKSRTIQATPRLRFQRTDRTTTEADRLQQAWMDVETGELIWQDVPIVIVPASHPDLSEANAEDREP